MCYAPDFVHLRAKEEILQHRESSLASDGKIINSELAPWANAQFHVNVS